MYIQDYGYPFIPEAMAFWHIMSFVLGTVIGSFLNVCIWRIPQGESVVFAPSHCPKCGHELCWHENIPLLSWLFLRGRCSACKGPITPRYFLVELLTGLMFFVLFFKVTTDHQPLSFLIVYYGMVMLIVTTAFIDYEHKIIPDKTTYPAMLLGLAVAVAFPYLWRTDSRLWAGLFSLASLTGSAAVLALFAVFGKLLFKVEALGWGDVKYMAAVGACLGPAGAFFTLLFGSLAGAVVGVGMLATKRKGLKSAIPFGPFLAVGSYLWMVFGERLLMLYFNLFKCS